MLLMAIFNNRESRQARRIDVESFLCSLTGTAVIYNMYMLCNVLRAYEFLWSVQCIMHRRIQGVVEKAHDVGIVSV